MAKQKSSATAIKKTQIPKTTTFTLFPRLPAEIRIEIWKWAAFTEPQNISIERSRTCLHGNTYEMACDNLGYSCRTTAVPSILHTCREARDEGLRHYRLMEWLPEAQKGETIYGEGPARIYINWKVDRIVIFNFNEFIKRSWFIRVDGNSRATSFWKLHPDDRSAAWDLVQKFIENDLKYVAVDTGNNSDDIESFFKGLYPWECQVEEIIFFSSSRGIFKQSFEQFKGYHRKPLSCDAFRQPKSRKSSDKSNVALKYLVDRFKIHQRGREAKLSKDGKGSQSTEEHMPKIIPPIGFRGRGLNGWYFAQWKAANP